MEYTLITGASGGIGEAIAHLLAERKQNLILVARSSAKLESLSQLLSDKYKVTTHYIATDLSVSNAAQIIFDTTEKNGWIVDKLFNVGGIGSSGEFTDNDFQGTQKLIQLNITTLVDLSHLYLSLMKDRKKGIVVNIASMTAFMPVPYMATYAASKAFVRSFTEAVSEEYKPYNIHVMLVCPGLTRTNFNKAAGLDGAKADALSSNYDSSTFQTPEEVAREALSAMDRKKQFWIAGSINRFGANLLALVPNKMVAKHLANSYRKKIK